MKVVILCGGLGYRLREETEHKPKPMVEIGGRPILWHIMKIYAHYGFKDFILCLGYKGNVIREYFLNYEYMNNDFTINLETSEKMILRRNNREDWNVTLVDTGLYTEKGSRIKQIEPYISESDFMVTYGDGVSDLDLNKLLKFHRSHGRVATLTGVFPPSRFGEIVVEETRVKHFTEKPQASAGIINGGFFVFTKRIFDYLDDSPECDLEHGTLERLAQEGELMVYEYRGFWACMDTIRDVQHLNHFWDIGNAPWAVWRRREG